jgi:hypothetical protein
VIRVGVLGCRVDERAAAESGAAALGADCLGAVDELGASPSAAVMSPVVFLISPPHPSCQSASPVRFPGSQITQDALNFVPSPGGVTDVYNKPALFRSIFANDLPASEAAVLAATQEPIAASALTEPSGPPAWAAIPSWDVIGTADHAIPPAAQEFMAARAHARVTKIDASHLSMISQPGTVTNVIEQAARATS